jgi:enoyl-CoA hydratase
MVSTEKHGHVTTIIMDRPEVRNAVDRATAEALAGAFRDFEAEPEARVAVFWGNHGNFCAGADLKAIAAGRGNLTQAEGDGPMGPSRMLLSKPSIAAVSGYAVAGGFELALLCDLRIVEEDAIMGVFNRRWGIPLIDGGTVRLPRLIGLGRALDLIITGRAVTAEEALQMGLANRIVPRGEARQAAEKLGRELADFPQVCLRSDRMSAYEQFGLTFTEAMENEFRHGQQALRDEATSGAQRFSGGAGRHGKFGGIGE